jgi:hypothetical protein
VWQSPEIVSWYRPRNSLSALFRQYLQYGFWKIAVIRKHRLPASIRHLVPGAFVLWLLLSAIAALAGLLLDSTVAALAGVAAFSAAAIAYAGAGIAAALTCAKPYGRDVTSLLPLVFAVYHVSYGLGFLLGVSRAIFAGRGRGPGRFATEITR